MRLIGVTVTPGTPDQVGVVWAALAWVGRDIPVGAFNLEHRTGSAAEHRLGRDRREALRLQERLPPAPSEGNGKKLHDPLAACCAIEPAIGEWAEVDLYRERGKWGSRLSPGSGLNIIVGHDHERFLSTFTEHIAT